MRAFIFFVTVLALMGSGIWLFTQEGNIEIPFLQEQLESLIGATVEPEEQWDDVMIGKWNFRYQLNYTQSIHIFEGEVEYKSDSSFVKYLNFKRYASEYDIENGNATMIAGGSLSGTWKLGGNKTWIEVFTKCNIKNSYRTSYLENEGADVCDDYFDGAIRYGVYKSDVYHSRVVEFNEDKIHIKVKSFSSGKTSDFVLIRN